MSPLTRHNAKAAENFPREPWAPAMSSAVRIYNIRPGAEHMVVTPRTSAHRLVSYLVRTTPPGKVRVSTRFRFTQLSSVVQNGVPPPTMTG